MQTRLFVAIASVVLNFGVTPSRADEPVFEEIETIKSKFDPNGDMVNNGNGYFYGVARWSEEYGGGAIFRVAPRQSVEMIHEFSFQEGHPDPNVGGSSPTSNLSIGADGAFYGATQGGGAHGWGVIYRITAEGNFTVLMDIKSTDVMWVTNVLRAPDGFVYGCSSDGGVFNHGRLFRVSPEGLFEVLHDFGSPDLPLGSRLTSPRSLCIGADGMIYGTTIGGKTLFRLEQSGQIASVANLTDLEQWPIRCFPTTDGFYITTHLQLFHVSLSGVRTELANFQADGKGASVSPVTGVVTPEGFYGITFRGGLHESGFVYRYLKGNGVEYLHDFVQGYQLNSRSLALGNDGLAYGILVLPEEAPGQSAITVKTQSPAGDQRAKRTPAATAGTSFRMREASVSVSNFFPAVSNETVMLPAKAKGGSRGVSVSILSNDRDPDGDPLSVAGVGDAGDGLVELVSRKGRPSLLFSTLEVDPPSRKITYQVADNMGGQSTGILHILSPAKGIYQGGDGSSGELTVSIGSGNQCKVTLLSGGRRYSGKAALDSSDQASLQLMSEGVSPAMLRLQLERGVTRQVAATVVIDGELSAIICEISGNRR